MSKDLLTLLTVVLSSSALSGLTGVLVTRRATVRKLNAEAAGKITEAAIALYEALEDRVADLEERLTTAHSENVRLRARVKVLECALKAAGIELPNGEEDGAPAVE